MAHYYLVPYIGTGTDADPYRPHGSDQPGWAAIDLRPDSTVPTGFALLSLPVRDDQAVRRYLGDALDEPSTAIKQELDSRLSISLTATRLRHQIAELLLEHGADDGTRWRPLRPTVAGRYEIFLGERVYSAPLLRGGATITESFNTADSSTLGPDLTWTEIVGNPTVSGNKYLSEAAVTPCAARADSALDTDNHYAQGIGSCANSGSATDTFIGLICRQVSGAAQTNYHFQNRTGTSGATERIRKIVTGTITQLLSEAGDETMVDILMRFEVNGSSLEGFKAGVSVIQVTDTALTGNLFTGIYSQKGGAGPTPTMDSFEAGDLAAAVTHTPPVGAAALAGLAGLAVMGTLLTPTTA